MFKLGRNRAVCLREEAIFVPAQKCPYHVIFDLDLDFEHKLDAGWPVDHRVQVWSLSGHLPATRVDFRDRHKSAFITWPFTLTSTLSTTWMRAHVLTIMCKFGSDRAIFGVVVAIPAKKVHRHTDWQTDDRRRAIVLAHSLNELKTGFCISKRAFKSASTNKMDTQVSTTVNPFQRTAVQRCQYCTVYVL